MRIKYYLFILLSLLFSANTFAHGLMESPASRNWICGAVTKPDQVDNGTAQTPICGEAFAVNPIAGYSFMSVLTHNLGRASVTPLPDNVCSFGSETWKGAVTPWDMPIDWPTNPMTSGEQTITWNISWGPHFDDTAEFRYWITKPDFVFSKTKALTWDDFESTPFCVLNYEDSTPLANPNVVSDKAAQKFHTKCTVPARSGHHVIYGEWGRKPPTLERFHGCIDGAFGGVVNPVVAQIVASPANASFTGAGTITFSGATSQGTNLTYQWAVESANTSLYNLSSATGASTTLTLKNPQAQTTFTVRLTVSNGTNSNSASLNFTHIPTAASNWQDFGALSSSARALNVGDKVNLRMVNNTGADIYFPATPLTITSANAGESAWPYALAQQINAGGGDLQVGVLNSTDNVVAAQNATSNRIYAKVPTSYVSAFLQVAGASSSSSVASSKSSSSVKTSSSSSSAATGQQCNWYGTLYPLCVTTASGWGWENNKNCIAASTCSAQPAPYGIVGGAASSAASSSLASSVSSKSSVTSSIASSAKSSVTSSVKSSSSSSSKSSVSSVANSSAASSVSSSGSNCAYVISNQWNTGFTAAIRITNNRTTAINGWSVNWSYTDGSVVTSSWNATLTGSNPYSASNISWNGTIQPGQTVEFGLQGTKTAATASVPVVTGSACN